MEVIVKKSLKLHICIYNVIWMAEIGETLCGKQE